MLDLRSLFDSLIPREQEVLALVTGGLLNKQIAAEIGLAEITVKIHRGHLMKKMGARSSDRQSSTSPPSSKLTC